MKYHTLKWFKNRIKKTIYRDKLSCPCDMCQNEEVFIKNEDAAYNIFMHQNDLDIEYFDTQKSPL